MTKVNDRRKVAVALAIGVLFAACLGVGTSASADEIPIDQLPEYPALDAMANPDGSASVAEFTIEAGQYRGPDGERITIAATASYTCILTVDNPHWSSGSQSVIAKPRVACKGPVSTIPIRVQGLLGKTSANSIPTLRTVAESNYVNNVTVNSSTVFGPRQTWYVPREGSGTRISRGAYFRGSASAAASAPLLPFNIPNAASQFLWVP
ncbi:hypothetical protein [Microbacterium aurantiacum]|uniref:hypothetical protein n=1 Tax=Microbacterium aurantiacum TaxID=162393 RepID=UPI001F224218|nr:hypothetical protein [Microbacterium aurantiacum]